MLSLDSHGYFWPSALRFCLESAVLSCFARFLQHCSREGAGEEGSAVCRAVLIAGWWSLERNLPQGEQAATFLLSLETWGFWIGCLREACLSRVASSQSLRIPGAGQVTMLSLIFQSGWGNRPCIHSGSVPSHLCLHPNVFLKRPFIPKTK